MIKFTRVSRSAIGLVRLNNEDSFFCDEPLGIFAVADGMGGGAEGERASKVVCNFLARKVNADTLPARLDQINLAIASVNREILEYSTARRYSQMGSTIALVAFDLSTERNAAICHIGDSRVYRLRKGKGELLTCDHTMATKILGAGEASRKSPLSHILTRAIGVQSQVSPDWSRVDVACGDRFVICSDGVHDVINDDEFADLLSAKSLQAAADRLEQTILARGAPDNYTFILIDVKVDSSDHKSLRDTKRVVVQCG